MTNQWQSHDKSMLSPPAEKSTKGGAIILYHSPTDYEIFSSPKNFQTIPETDMHDEDLYTYQNFSGAKS